MVVQETLILTYLNRNSINLKWINQGITPCTNYLEIERQIPEETAKMVESGRTRRGAFP